MQFLLLEAPKLVIARNSHQRNACIVHLCPIASDSKCYAEKKWLWPSDQIWYFLSMTELCAFVKELCRYGIPTVYKVCTITGTSTFLSGHSSQSRDNNLPEWGIVSLNSLSHHWHANLYDNPRRNFLWSLINFPFPSSFSALPTHLFEFHPFRLKAF